MIPSADQYRPPVAPERSDESTPRKAFIGSMYFLGFLMSVGLSALSIWQFVVWTDALFLGTGSFQDFLKWFLSSVSIVYSVRWVFLLRWMLVEFFDEQRRMYPDPPNWPFVSIFLPAYNEEQSIATTIESMLVFDYPKYEIIVIDDGSTDRTSEIARAYEGEYDFGAVRVLTKINGGKWTAHNWAFRNSTGDLILCVDADGRMDPDSLRRAVRRLESEPSADAVAGYTRVMNRRNLILNLQALEFVIWNGAMREPQSRHGAVMCIPGPLGLFRRSAMQRVWDQFGKLDHPAKPGEYDGPFEGDTFAEDFDLTLAIQMTGGRVIYDRRAGCSTDCPDSVFSLLNQRYRWSRGSIQVVKKVLWRSWKNPAHRNWTMLAWLSVSYLYDMAVYAFALAAYSALIAVTLLNEGDQRVFLAYLFLSLLFKLVIAIPFLMDHREDWRLLLLLPFIDLYGTFLLGGAFVISMIDEVFKTRMRW